MPVTTRLGNQYTPLPDSPLGRALDTIRRSVTVPTMGPDRKASNAAMARFRESLTAIADDMHGEETHSQAHLINERIREFIRRALDANLPMQIILTFSATLVAEGSHEQETRR